MWTRLFGVSARCRRKLKARWYRAGEVEVRRRQEALALDRDAIVILTRWAGGCCDANMSRRILTVVNYADGWPPGYIAEAFRCDPATVSRVLARYYREGPSGLVDKRENNGPRKVDGQGLRRRRPCAASSSLCPTRMTHCSSGSPAATRGAIRPWMRGSPSSGPTRMRVRGRP